MYYNCLLLVEIRGGINLKSKTVQKIISVILLLIIIGPNFVFADSKEDKGSLRSEVVALGADLNLDQRNQVLKIFGFDSDSDVDIIEVTNQEERQYLGEYIDSSMIGTRAISSVYLEKLKKGKGITVELYNISWVSEEMYKNAAITAGVEDARIVVASPFDVSGTSALTGIIKSFEDVTGEKIDEEVKDLANQEMAIMGELKDAIGNKKTIELIVKVKQDILNNNYTLDGDIRESVEKILKELNIELSKEDIQNIIDFLNKLSKTNIDKEGILENIKSIKVDVGIIRSILEAIRDFLAKIFG